MAQKKKIFRLAFIFAVAVWCSACAASSLQPALTATAPAAKSPTILPSASAKPFTSVPSSAPAAITATRSKTTTALAQPFTATALPTQPVNTAGAVRENTPVPQPAAPISVDNADRISELAIWGNGSANDLAYSPDGSTLAVVSSLGIYLYDDNSYRLEVIATDVAISSLAFSPDGETLAVGDVNGKINIWRWRTKEHIHSFDSGVKSAISYLTYSPLGDTLGYSQAKDSYGFPKFMYVIQVLDGKKLVESERALDQRFVFSNDGQSIYYAAGGSAGLISIPSGKIVYLENNDNKYETITSVAISQNGMIVAGDNRKFFSWEMQSNRLLWEIDTTIPEFIHYGTGCEGAFESVGIWYFTTLAISPDGMIFVVGSIDDAFQIRRVSDGSLLFSTPGEKPTALFTKIGVQKISFHPSGPKFAMLYGNGLIEERDTQSGKLLDQLTGHPQSFTSLAVWPKSTPNQSLLAVGASNAATHIWDLTNGKIVSELGWQANTLAFSPDGKMLALGSDDWSVRLVSLADGKLIGPLTDHQDQVTGMTFFQDGKTLVSVSYDCTLRLWDVSGNPPKSSAIPTGINFSDPQVISSPDEKWLVVLGEEISSVKITDQGNYSLTPIISMTPIISNHSSESIVFSPDSKILAGVGNGGIIAIDIKTGETLYVLNDQGERIAFSPDSKLIATGDTEGNIMLLDTQTGNDRYGFQAHRGRITGLAFSNDGHILISTSADGTVRLWGVTE